ncbi:HAMP domain-containing sensor histidine kinase [Actinoplanes sp. NPDC049596]|uniref:HAMP domain-containing sensor histidine kinase n=1 Tax=unclassified Actinoplanes TaxID=2626549 RepID=UPI00342A21B5
MLFFLAGFLALVGIAGHSGPPARLLIVAALDFALGVAGFLVPWQRLRPESPALLGLAGFAVLGLSTWSFGGVAAGTGPFLVLLYTWAALHMPRWILLAYAVPAGVAYLLPLILTNRPPEVLSSALVLLPVAVAIALLVEAQARHLREDRERLARIETWQTAMMSTLAHDVRSPLATVQFALEELGERAAAASPDSPSSRAEARMIEAALRQTARIRRLADGLLDVQRIDSSGHLRLDRKPTPAAALLRDAVSYTSGRQDVAIEAEENLLIFVDPQRFEQIVINLVGNALRYGRPPVVVRLTRDGGIDRLEIRDHGPGIPETLRPHLFGRFAVGGPDGVGLGLWIVRSLTEAHDGTVVAEAREPGVAMVVTIPSPQPQA